MGGEWLSLLQPQLAPAASLPYFVTMVYSSYTKKCGFLKGNAKDLAFPLIQGNTLERTSILSTYKLRKLD